VSIEFAVECSPSRAAAVTGVAVAPAGEGTISSMSIRALVEDAQDLWQRGRQESAFALTMIAFAATARRRYPRSLMPDNKAFKTFIRDEQPKILGTSDTGQILIPVGGRGMTLEDILYRRLRCELLHEGEMPEEIVFTPSRVQEGELAYCIALTDPLELPEAWVLNMLRVVVEARENQGLF
jgi:hypothetical protein